MDAAPVDVEPVEPAPVEAPAPPPLVRDGADVAIRDPDGTVSMVASRDLQAAIGEGARPATETEWQNAKLGVAGEVASAAIGAGQGLSFGYAAPALIRGAEAVGAEGFAGDVRKGVQIAKDTSPNAYLGGELAGSLAGVAVMPGGAFKGVTGEGVIARAASRAMGLAPRAFAEGAAMGVGQQLTEDALGNHDAVAEKYVAAGLEGGVLASVLGLGLHIGGGAVKDKIAGAVTGTGRKLYGVASSLTESGDMLAGRVGQTGEEAAEAIRKISGPDLEALAERQFGYAPKGLGEKVREAYVKGAAGVSGKDVSVVDRLTAMTPEGREARRIAVFDADAEIAATNKRLRTAGDDMLLATPEVTDEFRGALKGDKIAAAVKPDNEVRHVVMSIDPNAGLGEKLPGGTSRPFRIGEEQRPMVLGQVGQRVDRKIAVDAESPFSVYRAKYPAPDAGLPRVELGVDLDAGLHAAEDVGVAFRPSSMKQAPRGVGLAEDIEVGGTLKTRNPIAVETQVQVPEGASHALAEIRRAAAAAERELAGEPAKNMVQTLRDIVRSTTEAEAEILGSIAKKKDINSTSFMALDRVKRDIQGFTSGGYRRVGMMTNPYEARLAKGIVGRLDGLQGSLRSGLERTDLWGKAGEIQKAINAEWTIQIEASQRFNQALTTDVGRRADNPFLKQKGIDPSKLDTYARNLLNPNADLTHKAVKDYVSSTERLAKTIREHVDLPPEKLAQVARIESAAKRFAEAAVEAEKKLTLVNQYKHLTAGGGDGFAALGGMLGLASGNPLGGILGAAVGSLASPGRAVAQLAALERMQIKVDEKIGGAVRSFLGGAKQATAKGGGAAAEATQKVTAQMVRTIRESTRSPEALTAKLAATLGGRGLTDAAPKTSRAMSTTVMRLAAHLRDKAPKEPMQTGLAFVPQKPREPSKTEMARYAQTVQGAINPLSVVDDLDAGRLSPEKVETLKVGYPQIYQQIRAEIASQATELRPKLSTQQEIALSVLFDVPVSAMMEPGAILSFQKTIASQGAESQKAAEAGQPNTAVRGLKRRGTLASGFDKQEAPT